MPNELECGSEAEGRYTCRYAPVQSVCCTNGCCANPASNGAYTSLPLWARIVIAVSVGLAMVLLFLALRYRDRRGYRAYKRLRDRQAACAAAAQPGHEAAQPQEGREAPAASSAVHEPTREARE